MSWPVRFFFLFSTFTFLSGCGSSQVRQRREQRDRVIQTSRLYCDFMSGEQYPDVEVALNLSMAQKCDPDKNFTITNYKTSQDVPGILYCCSMHPKSATPANQAPVTSSSQGPRSLVVPVPKKAEPATPAYLAPVASPTPAAAMTAPSYPAPVIMPTSVTPAPSLKSVSPNGIESSELDQ